MEDWKLVVVAAAVAAVVDSSDFVVVADVAGHPRDSELSRQPERKRTTWRKWWKRICSAAMVPWSVTPALGF